MTRGAGATGAPAERRRMKRLQRYVLRELALPAVGSFVFFTAMLVITRLFRLTDLLFQTDIRGGLMGQLLLFLTLSLISVTIPMALLLATLTGFGRLASEHEILAIRASGVSLWAVFRPALAGGLVMALALAWFNADVAPNLFRRARELLLDVRFDVITNLQPQTYYADPDLPTGDFDISLYYEKRIEIELGGKQTRLRMKDIALQLVAKDERNSTEWRETLIFAREGDLIGDRAAKSLTVQLRDGCILPINAERPEESAVVTFGRMTRMLQSEGKVKSRTRESDLIREYTAAELWRDIRRPPDGAPRNAEGGLRGVWRTYYRKVNELLLRLSLPFACVAFLAIGMPLAIAVRRGQKSVAFAITFLLMFIYYMIFDYGRALGERGSTTGWFLILLPNFLLCAIGFVMMARAARS